jgi:co-chaperonin GroES (HSP10)
MISPDHIQAFGPWILVKVDPTPEKSDGGVYLPQGNLEERTGYRTGVAVSVGQGFFNKSVRGRVPKTKFSPSGVEVGDRIRFRGVIHDVNRYHQGIEGLGHCLVHAQDVEGVITE